MKKITSVLVTLAMVVSMLPTFAFAANNSAFTDVDGNEYYANAAEALAELDILEGYDDGSFGATRDITRAEMAAIICRMLDKENDAEKVKGITDFEDVSSSHWAAGYINYASDNGIIEGDGDGKFRPEDNVKYEEAIKMVVCAVGLGDDVTVDPKDWSKEYLEIADDNGITDDVKGRKGNASPRGDVAVMVYNGLTRDLEAPSASKKEGTYSGTQKIELSTTTKDAEIYYTTDGSTPTIKSSKYTKAISISKTTTIKAIAIVNDVLASDVMSVEYTIRTSSGGGSSVTKYTVTFNTNGGSEIPPQTIRSGANATEPEEPEKDGYTFMGWLDATGNYYDFGESITENITLTAEWLKTIQASEEELNELAQKQIGGDVSADIQSDIITGVDVDYMLDGMGAVGISELSSDPMLRTAGLVGNPVEINANGANVTEATITFHYDPSKIADADDLAIVWYDEKNDVVTLLDNSIVDTNSNTVSVVTSHFSKYGVILRQIWDAAWNTQLSAVRTDDTPYYDILLAMDCSGSMSGNKMSKSIEAAQNLIDILTDDDTISVLAFESNTKEIVSRVRLGDNPTDGSSDNRTYVKDKISTLRASGGTNIEAALNYAVNNKITDKQYQSLVILLSDGQSSVYDSVLQNLKSNSQKVISVGIGSDVDKSLMQRIATSTDGSYLYCENATDLVDAFIELQNTYIGSTTDTDGDGLPDLVEKTGMRDQYGEIWTTDPYNSDSDGDGISDGDEMGNYNPLVAHPYFNRVSRPDLYTVKSNEAYVLMPETMSHAFVSGENKLKLMVYITDCGYRMAPDLVTPIEDDGIPKEYIYSPAKNLKAELLNIPSGFTLESMDIIEETKLANGYGTDYQAVATLSYSKTTELDSVTWKITADNCSEWSGYAETGIKANYIQKTQKIEPQKVENTNDKLETAQLNMAVQSKKLVESLYNNADTKNESDISDARNKIKSKITTTGNSVPNEIYDAFALAIFEVKTDSKLDAYETDPIKLTNQIYEKLVASIKTSSTTVTINNHKYNVTLHEEMFNSTGNAWAYIYPETGGMTTLTYTNVFDDEGKEALANYCALLAQLNTDLWKEFLAYYVSDGFGLLDIKTVTKKNVLDVLNKTEKVIKALSDTSLTKADTNALVEEMGDTVKDKLKSGLTNKFKKFVQENVPNGDKIVSASEKYKKAKEKYDKFKKLWDADSTSDKTQKAYNDFQTAYSAFETIVNGL